MIDFICMSLFDLQGPRNNRELPQKFQCGIRTHAWQDPPIGRQISFHTTTGSAARHRLNVNVIISCVLSNNSNTQEINKSVFSRALRYIKSKTIHMLYTYDISDETKLFVIYCV